MALRLIDLTSGDTTAWNNSLSIHGIINWYIVYTEIFSLLYLEFNFSLCIYFLFF